MTQKKTISTFQQISSKTLLLVIGGNKNGHGGIAMLKKMLKKRSRFGS